MISKTKVTAEITQYIGSDGVLVVEIDTPDLPESMDGPVIRIYLNDSPVFENPEYSGGAA